MGYRSEVGMAIVRESKDAPSVPEVLAMAKTKGLIAHDFFEKEWNDEDYGWDDDHFLFYVEWVKWYESFVGVEGMEGLYRFFDELNQDEDEADRSWYSGKFVRCGEEITDNQEEAFGDGWQIEAVGLRRQVHMEDQLGLLGNQNKLTDVNKESEHA